MASGERRFLAGWGVDVGLLLIRVMVGWVFVYHGSQKVFGAFGGDGMGSFVEGLASMGFPLPTLNAYAAAGAEFFGGLALMFGLLTRVAGVFTAFTMFVAAFVVHGGAFGLQHGGMEFALTLGIVSTALVLAGPGRVSVDGVLWQAAGLRARPGGAAPEPAV